FALIEQRFHLPIEGLSLASQPLDRVFSFAKACIYGSPCADGACQVGTKAHHHRRVKEQLKKMGSFEFIKTSFSLIDNDTREEKFVGVPEQGGRDMISLDPLAPGSVYTCSVDNYAKVGLYRLEVGCSPGTGKLKIAGGIDGEMRESINRAFA